MTLPDAPLHIDDTTTWRVLLVDDDPDNLTLAGELLRFHGAQVEAASSADEALARLQSCHPNLLLLDLSMPVMDGWQLYRAIRAVEGFAHTPAIALTAHAMRGDAEKALAFGFDGYITKPFDPRGLVESIQACLRALG